MPHTCSTLIVHCMDFRFIRDIRAWMEGRGMLGDCDVVAVPGVAKVLVDPQMLGDADFLLRAIGVAVNLHGAKRIILLNHLDCGAYGGARAFAAPQDERKRHERHLRRGAEIVRERFPHVAVAIALAELRPDGSVQFDEVAARSEPQRAVPIGTAR